MKSKIILPTLCIEVNKKKSSIEFEAFLIFIFENICFEGVQTYLLHINKNIQFVSTTKQQHEQGCDINILPTAMHSDVYICFCCHWKRVLDLYISTSGT